VVGDHHAAASQGNGGHASDASTCLELRDQANSLHRLGLIVVSVRFVPGLKALNDHSVSLESVEAECLEILALWTSTSEYERP
jgi:hypothetical protein